MRTTSLPAEFAELAGKVSFVQQKNSTEFSSTCPQCGGSIHVDGELPDRFVLLLRSTATGGAFGFCRICGYKWLPGRDPAAAVDPETLAKLEAQAQAYREQVARERAEKLASFTTSELWAELHARMQAEQREWWRTQGVPDEWQDYLKLGYTPEKVYMGTDKELHKSPAYTIPYFHFGWEFCTIQYRLVDPDFPRNRYRFESKLGTTYYMATPNQPIKRQAIVCEGAKKAMVTCIRNGDMHATTTFLAVPSKEDWKQSGVIEALKGCDKIWIIFDPDCWHKPPQAKADWQPAPILFALALGRERARVVDMPAKVDDAILQMGMDKQEFMACLHYGRRL